MTDRKRFLVREDGALSVEATLVLPFFLAFVIALQTLIELATIQMALRSAVSETVKETAAHLYPVQLAYREAEERLGRTKSAQTVRDVLDKIESVRARVQGLEDGAEQSAAFIPDSVLEIVRWEKEKRESIEQLGQDGFERVKKSTFDAAVNRAFTEIAYRMSSGRRLQKDRFHVVKVELPDLNDREDGLFAIEAEYEADLHIPLVKKTIRLREKAAELAWLE